MTNTKNLFTNEDRKVFMETNGEGVYSGKGENGEDLAITVAGGAMEITVFQNNGWIRIDEYDEYGIKVSESFEGRWKKAQATKMESETDDEVESKNKKLIKKSLRKMGYMLGCYDDKLDDLSINQIRKIMNDAEDYPTGDTRIIYNGKRHIVEKHEVWIDGKTEIDFRVTSEKDYELEYGRKYGD